MNARIFPVVAALIGLSNGTARAEYHGFDEAKDVQATVQEVRWPFWAESTYNAIYSQTIRGEKGVSVYFYGGVPFASPEYPAKGSPASIIWSFWPPDGIPGASVKPVFTGPNTYAPPHIGEGASGKIDGLWPQMKTKQWYRFACRIWKPADGSADHGFAAKWLRDPETGVWHHYATMRLPFAPTGMSGLGGFIEDFSHGNRNPRRADYRNVYYLRPGGWESAARFSASVRQKGERGTVDLIDNGSAAFFETCASPSYKGNLDFDTGPKERAVTIKQPPKPEFDPILVERPRAIQYGGQLLVAWDMAPKSSPQFAWKIEVFDNPACSGKPAFESGDRDPSVRQKLLEIPAIANAHVRLTITDLFDRSAKPLVFKASTPKPAAAVAAKDTVPGLAFAFYQDKPASLADWKPGKPVLSGGTASPDLTPRLRREGYAFVFDGFLDIPKTGLYAFTLRSADGSRLEIDGHSVVDHDGIHSPSDKQGCALLAAGEHAVKLSYFFDKQNGKAGDDIDQLSLRYAGPGIPLSEIPVSVWSRAKTAGLPDVALTEPKSGTSLPSGNVALKAEVKPNGATVEKVRFYADGYLIGEDATEPYTLDVPLWNKPANKIRARAICGGGVSVDSPVAEIATTPESTAPWTLASASDHVQGFGGSAKDGNLRLIGDGLNVLCREVTGDCTLTAHVSDIAPAGPGADGKHPDWSWHAGIMLRQSLEATPGMPLGNNEHPYAAVYSTVNYSTHFQDNTMANAGGGFWSRDLGRQRWLRLQRNGQTITTSVSEDGTAWKECNKVALKDAKERLFAGVFTYAAPSENTNVHHADFDHVTLTSP